MSDSVRLIQVSCTSESPLLPPLLLQAMRAALLSAGAVTEDVLAPYDTRIYQLGRWVRGRLGAAASCNRPQAGLQAG